MVYTQTYSLGATPPKSPTSDEQEAEVAVGAKSFLSHDSQNWMMGQFTGNPYI